MGVSQGFFDGLGTVASGENEAQVFVAGSGTTSWPLGKAGDAGPDKMRGLSGWRKPAGETALPARTAARRESRSTLKTALASCAAASAARTPG